VGRSRTPGGGRKRAEELQPGLVGALDKLVDPESRGDPMTPLRWTSKSLRTLATELAGQGYQVSASLIQRLLHEAGYSLQSNAKTLEGHQHADRDAQFRHIHDTVTAYTAAGDPVVSIDCKKKELVGQYKNNGQAWRPQGDPERVDVHDFLGEGGKAIPYGVYDVGANTGWVNVGVDHETAAFAVTTLRSWWNSVWASAYPDATRLLITADSGGANGNRRRTWKTELAALAAETSLNITVSHLPPGTSKWNKIEHRTVLPNHQKLARQAPEHPRNDPQPHRRHHHDNGTERDRRTRRRCLPHRYQDHRPANEDPSHHSRRLARRMELHAAPHPRHARTGLT